jgi:Protein of unknown function (DUF4054)
MIDYAGFIAAFPEFSNPVPYPQASVTFWITQAGIQLNARRFGASLDLATMLFVAHNMVLGAQAAATAATATGIVGEASGPVASKTVGPVSASYDTAAVAVAGAGFWNQTQYGQRLFQLMQAYCSGPSYVPGPSQMFGQFGRFGFPRFPRGF